MGVAHETFLAMYREDLSEAHQEHRRLTHRQTRHPIHHPYRWENLRVSWNENSSRYWET